MTQTPAYECGAGMVFPLWTMYKRSTFIEVPNTLSSPASVTLFLEHRYRYVPPTSPLPLLPSVYLFSSRLSYLHCAILVFPPLCPHSPYYARFFTLVRRNSSCNGVHTHAHTYTYCIYPLYSVTLQKNW